MNDRKLLTESNLRRLINRETFGNSEPYVSGTQEEIEQYLETISALINNSPNIQAEARGIKAFDYCWGGGYSSFTDIFVSRKNKSSRDIASNDFEVISGIRIYISRLAPIAALGMDRVRINRTGRSGRGLIPEHIFVLPDDSWNIEEQEICTKLQSNGYTLLTSELAKKELPFEAEITTIMSNPPYTIFDAIFYWYD